MGNVGLDWPGDGEERRAVSELQYVVCWSMHWAWTNVSEPLFYHKMVAWLTVQLVCQLQFNVDLLMDKRGWPGACETRSTSSGLPWWIVSCSGCGSRNLLTTPMCTFITLSKKCYTWYPGEMESFLKSGWGPVSWSEWCLYCREIQIVI